MQRNSGKEMLLVVLRTVFVSLELLVLVGVYALISACPSVVELASKFPNKWEVLGPITVATAVLFGWQLKVVHEMRNPQNPNAPILHEWPDYEKLCIYCKVATYYGVISVALSASWMLSDIVPYGVAIILTGGGVMLMCVSYLCCHNAKDDMEHILTRFGTRTGK